MSSILLRPATVTDATSIAKVHVASWRSTYAGIVSGAYLDSLSETEKAKMWESILSDPAPGTHINVLLGQTGKVLGFSSGGVNRSPNTEFVFEVYAIYLLKEAQGVGFGKQLFCSLIKCFESMGKNSFMVWALAENPACGFYERMGGVKFAEQKIDIGGTDFREIAFGWQSTDLKL